jgi:hypothetical protein
LFKLYLDIFYLLNVHILSQKCDSSNKYSNPINGPFRDRSTRIFGAEEGLKRGGGRAEEGRRKGGGRAKEGRRRGGGRAESLA